MDDLISRAAAIEYLMTNMDWYDEDDYVVDDADEKRTIITDLVNGIPTVDAVPVVHGRVLRTDAWPHRLYCSKCYNTIVPNEEYVPLHNMQIKYCPNCGAKMDGGDDDANGT